MRRGAVVRFPPFPAGLGIGFASEEKGISPLPAISPLQRPGGDAFSFEDILDMGISSLGIWDLAKSQAHPGASLTVQLEPWPMLPCLLQLRVLVTWEMAVSAAGYPHPSPLLGHLSYLLACSWGDFADTAVTEEVFPALWATYRCAGISHHLSVCSLLLVTHTLQLPGLQPA